MPGGIIPAGQGPVRGFEATEIVGESTRAAYLDAEAWLVKASSAPGEASTGPATTSSDA